MAFIADRLAAVKPSATVGITARALALKAEGEDVISLGAGEADFDTPSHIQDAAVAAMKAGKIRYTQVDGLPALKSAIQAKFARENGLDYDLSEIGVASGGKQVIYNALLATLNAGDEVIIPAPYWVSYPDMVALCGGQAVIAETRIEDSYKLTPDGLRNAITPNTKWLMLNSPSNPTGAAYSRAELAALADVLAEYPDIWVMSDDIYEHLLFDGGEFVTLAQIAPALKDRILIVNGVSKTYAMTGWRIGYGAAPKALIDAMRKIASQTTSCPSAIGQYAAIEALNGPQDFLADARAMFQARRDFVVDALNAIDGIRCPKPDGAFYVYPSIADFIGGKTASGQVIASDEDFANALLEDALVAVVFGAAFGASPNFRISYAASMTELEEACARIRRFCEKIS